MDGKREGGKEGGREGIYLQRSFLASLPGTPHGWPQPAPKPGHRDNKYDE